MNPVPMHPAEPSQLLELAVHAAVRAGRMLTSGRSPGRPKVVRTKSSPTDVVTEMDRASERLIIDHIRAERPHDAFLGEEGGCVQPAANQTVVRWIIDPIDGTVNYLYGLADWAVSIAAEWSGTVLAGVVHVPERGELFTAIRGRGSWLRHAAHDPHDPHDPHDRHDVHDPPGGRGADAVRLRCGAEVRLAQALVATGFGYEAATRAVQGRVVAALLPAVRDIRRGGSCAVDLCSVAAGRVDAYYERGINYWDRAAGGLIAAEAGALLGGLPGEPPGPELTIAAVPGVFEELQRLLATLGGGPGA